jgi:hypothetical protein
MTPPADVPLARLAACALLSLAACTDPAPAPTDAAADARSDAAEVSADVAPPEDVPPMVTQDPNDCDPLDEAQCAFPWPSNLYLQPVASRPTGHALRFGRTSLPRNRTGVFIDASSLAHMDGYGLGTPMMTVFPNVDVSMMADENTLERSMAADAPALLFEVAGTTLRRVPYWVELDSQEQDVARKTFFLHPAVILKEATRYIVAFRGLRTTAGAAIAPSRAFAALRDGMTAGDARLAPRQARFTEVLGLLEGAGVTRASLTLAWDFNTASSRALHGRMLAMRDDALMRVGPMGPELQIDDVRTFLRADDGSNRPVDANIAVELGGSITVPDYTREQRIPTAAAAVRVMNLDESGRPLAQGTTRVPFIVRIPHSAMGGDPHGIVLYGHGLLGSNEEVRASNVGTLANTHRLIAVAASLAGMNEEDVGTVFGALQDMTWFRAVGERLHQGIVQWVVLARALRARLGSQMALTSRNVRVNTDELFYAGNSQGGIFGGTFMAVTPDVTRGYLGVPGNNYGTLLHRSTDFTSYFTFLRMSYRDSQDQAILLAYTQLQWDGTDPVSYLRHIQAEPFPGNMPHAVLLAPAKGDYQVSVMTNEIAARTDIGIPLMANYDRERMPYGCTQAAYPRRGSGVVLFDYNNPWPAPGNRPPTVMPPGDPHGRPRAAPHHQRQIATFFRTGEIVDVCGGDGCRPD